MISYRIATLAFCVASFGLVGGASAHAPFCPAGHSQRECDAVWAASQAVAATQGQGDQAQIDAGAAAYQAVQANAEAPFGPADRAAASAVLRRGRAVLRTRLYDFPSARFDTVRAKYTVGSDGRRNYFICGQVNAKNAFGAYAGWSGFAVADMDQGTKVFLESGGTESLLYAQVCAEDAGTWDSADYSGLLR